MGYLKIPKITTLQRMSITPYLAELLYDTDEGVIYTGDGTTVGGVSIYSSGVGTVGLTELKDEVKDLLYMQRVEMGATNVIDWTNPNFTFLRNDLTANITIADSNLPQDFNTKEITLKVNIKSYAIDFPIYYNHMGGDWEEDVINTILIQCENGNSGSEVVNYWVNPKTV